MASRPPNTEARYPAAPLTRACHLVEGVRALMVGRGRNAKEVRHYPGGAGQREVDSVTGTHSVGVQV